MRWPSVPVSEIAKQVRGVSYDKSQVSNNPSQGLIPILRAGNIQDGSLLLNQDLVFVPESCVSSQQLLSPGDIVVAASSGSLDVVGKAAQIQKPWQGSFGAFCKVVRPTSDRIDPRYLHHFFQSSGYRRKVSSLAAGANINNLKNEHIDDLEIPLPPLEEQRRIAAILDKVPEVKTLNNGFVLKLRGLIQSLFSRTGEASLGVDADLKAISLGKLLAKPLRNGVSPSSHGTYECRVLTLSAITRGDYQPEASKLGYFTQEPTEDKKVCSDDFLICRGNGNLQLVGLGEFPAEDDPHTVFPDTMIAARLREDLVDRMYFSIAWKQGSTRRQIESLARTTNGTAKVNQTALESVELLLPPLQAQKDFALLYGIAKKMLESCESAQGCLDVLQSSLQNDFFQSLD